MNDRFEVSKDLYAELEALKDKLDQLEVLASVDLRSEPAKRRPIEIKQSFFGKLGSLSNSLTQLTRTRRRVESLEDCTADIEVRVEGLGERATVLLRAIENDFRSIMDVARALLDRVVDSQRRWEDSERRREDSERRRENSELRWEHEVTKCQDRVSELERLLRFERLTRQKAFTDFDRRLALSASRVCALPDVEKGPSVNVEPETTSVQSLLESFYYLLEERYRGTREEIKQRLGVYRNDLRAVRDRVGDAGLVVDIGCGRGEFLEVIREEGLLAVGIDSNEIQLDAARQHGLPVLQAEAHAYLRSLDDNSVLAVSGIHIVEHMPFVELIRLVQEIVRVLRSGGLLIFETPNPRNLIVGAHTFNLDPTHIRPLPPEVLEVLLESAGLSGIEIRPLHPSETLEPIVNAGRVDAHIASLLFGPQDYAIIGIRG